MYYKMWQMCNRHPSISCTYSHRCLEAEGMEKTHRFKQEDLAESVPLANSQQVCTPVDSLTQSSLGRVCWNHGQYLSSFLAL